jgi:hypothetical protein
VARQAWDEAGRALQALLDDDEDNFVPVRLKIGNQAETVRWVSTHAECNRLLGSMSPHGFRLYEKNFGAKAQRRLDRASKDEPPLLAEVVRRYFHTAAGAKATHLLATYFQDHGQYGAAALCYRRLLQHHQPQYAGFSPKELKEQLTKLNTKTAGISSTEWPLFRGNVSRSGQAHGSAPFLRNVWAKSNQLTEQEGIQETDNVLDKRTKEWIDRALTRHTTKKEVMIPAFFPVATGGKVIFRSYCGIHARDILTGELVWDSLTLASLDALVRDENRRATVQQWFNNYLLGGTQSILFENSTTGTLSTDGVRVYAVDDLAIAPHPSQQEIQMWGWNGETGINSSNVDMAQRSRLVAIDLQSGKTA